MTPRNGDTFGVGGSSSLAHSNAQLGGGDPSDLGPHKSRGRDRDDQEGEC